MCTYLYRIMRAQGTKALLQNINIAINLNLINTETTD